LLATLGPPEAQGDLFEGAPLAANPPACVLREGTADDDA
jgi:hypothetical protein